MLILLYLCIVLDGFSGTESDGFIWASQRFKMLVAVMLNSVFVHCHMPIILPNSGLNNITIDLKSDLCNCDNYHCLIPSLE